jgi:hypothetical protein
MEGGLGPGAPRPVGAIPAGPGTGPPRCPPGAVFIPLLFLCVILAILRTRLLRKRGSELLLRQLSTAL